MSNRTPRSNPEPKTLVESAYRNLHRDIIEGILPPGAKLRVEHLKDNYGVGAGTLREALSLLISDSLVVTQGQRGFRVAPVSLEDFEDITNMRVMLESEALRQAIALGDEVWEGDLLAAFHLLEPSHAKPSWDTLHFYFRSLEAVGASRLLEVDALDLPSEFKSAYFAASRLCFSQVGDVSPDARYHALPYLTSQVRERALFAPLGCCHGYTSELGVVSLPACG